MFINVLTQVVVLFILIILGIILQKTKILSEHGVKSITNLVLYIVTPCVITKSFIREFDASTLKNLLISFLIAILSHIGFIILSHLMIKDKKKANEKVLQFGTIFSNCGYMSIPLQQALLGDTGVFYSSSYIAISQLFIWSYGIIAMSGNKKYLLPKKLIFNPGIIGLLIGLLIFLLSIPVPKVLADPISYMASLNTPLPMVIIGFHLASSRLLEGLRNIKCIFAIIVRLIIFPLLTLAVMYSCGIRSTMLVSSIISTSAPSAAMTTMFADKFGRNTSLSVNMVSLSTALSLITMPIIITIAQYIA